MAQEPRESYSSMLDELRAKWKPEDVKPTKSSKKELNNNQAVVELLTTETTYNETLKRLNTAFQQTDLNVVFLFDFHEPIVNLLEISNQLLQNARDGIEKEMSDIERTTLKEKREGHLKDFFKIMENYVVLNQQFCDDQRKFPARFKEIDDFLKNYPEKLGLHDHLIAPIQRAARYKLLIDSIKGQQIALDESNLKECDSISSMTSSQLQLMNSALGQEPTEPQNDSGSNAYLSLVERAQPQTKPYAFGDWILKPFYNKYIAPKLADNKVVNADNKDAPNTHSMS
jgi:hypothetical protein